MHGPADAESPPEEQTRCAELAFMMTRTRLSPEEKRAAPNMFWLPEVMSAAEARRR